MVIRDFVVCKIGKLIPDRAWIEIKYFLRFKKRCNLKNPQTFNEKLQWLKLYDQRDEHTIMVDKYAMKEYVTKIVGPGHVVPVLGVWDRVEDIDFESLPNCFVLKVTHDCGGLVICKDKKNLAIAAAKAKLSAALKSDYYIRYREWPYKNVRPRIFAEAYMEDESGVELKDYKVFNFNGVPYCIQVDFDRFVSHKKNIYSTDWRYMELAYNFPTYPEHQIPRPEGLEKMLEIAAALSKEESFVRTDFYVVNGHVYVGEITFFPVSGYGRFFPEEYDLQFGSRIQLPEEKWVGGKKL